MPTETTHDALGLRPARSGGYPIVRCPLCSQIGYGFAAVTGETVICRWEHERSCAFRLVPRTEARNGHDLHWR